MIIILIVMSSIWAFHCRIRLHASSEREERHVQFRGGDSGAGHRKTSGRPRVRGEGSGEMGVHDGRPEGRGARDRPEARFLFQGRNMQSSQHRPPLHQPSPDQPPFHEARGQDAASRRQRHPPQGCRKRWQADSILLRRRLRPTQRRLTDSNFFFSLLFFFFTAVKR